MLLNVPRRYMDWHLGLPFPCTPPAAWAKGVHLLPCISEHSSGLGAGLMNAIQCLCGCLPHYIAMLQPIFRPLQTIAVLLVQVRQRSCAVSSPISRLQRQTQLPPIRHCLAITMAGATTPRTYSAWEHFQPTLTAKRTKSIPTKQLLRELMPCGLKPTAAAC